MDREERSGDGKSPVAGVEGAEGGGGEEQRQSTVAAAAAAADSSAEAPAKAAAAVKTPVSTETLAVAGTAAIVREGNGSSSASSGRAIEGVDTGWRGKGSRDWKRLPLRGCGTDDGGPWEAAGRRAAAVSMPDVRLLNRLVHYLATSNKALELKSEQHLKKASKNGGGQGSSKDGGGGGGGGGGKNGHGPPTPRRRTSGSASAKRLKSSGSAAAPEQLDIREISEERRLGVITDRQESAAIGLVQAWAETGSEAPPPSEVPARSPSPSPASVPDHQAWRAALASALTVLPKQTAESTPATWTFWERKMLCAALLAQGAPSSNNDDTVHPGVIRLMQGREPFDTSMDGMDMEVMKGFTWESIIA
ncbi:unnamed protein product, partial [Ectocarpus fasciculatus]